MLSIVGLASWLAGAGGKLPLFESVLRVLSLRLAPLITGVPQPLQTAYLCSVLVFLLLLVRFIAGCSFSSCCPCLLLILVILVLVTLDLVVATVLVILLAGAADLTGTGVGVRGQRRCGVQVGPGLGGRVRCLWCRLLLPMRRGSR